MMLAYLDGLECKLANAPKDANPYARNSKLFLAWLDGVEEEIA